MKPLAMLRSSLAASLTWVVGPMVVAIAAGLVAQVGGRTSVSDFFAAPTLLSLAERRAMEDALPSSVTNAAWTLGDLNRVRSILRSELDRLAGGDGRELAIALIRYGLVDTNPDGQRAVFARACAAHPPACEGLRRIAQDQAEARLVAPGNTLPLGLLSEHPPLPVRP